MPKKANILCCGGLQLLNPPASHANISRSRTAFRNRFYATTHDIPDSDITWPATASFTPYDLFKQDRGAPYSKHRFYDFVKIYHPDRPCNGHPLCKGISQEVRLQRYHIVVEAHEILSNPAKRAAYDQFGLGWSLHPSRPMGSWSRPGYDGAGPIFANATWEDWERWHNRHEPKQRHVVDHRTFARAVILLTLFGGAVQASWITQINTGYEERLRAVNEKSARFLTGRRENTANQSGSSEAKMQHFLIRRDPTGHGLKDEEQPVYQGVLHSRRPALDKDQTPVSENGLAQAKEPEKSL
ncbi:hypothetical protein SI65_05930 [Aspergillus cristatus]|uniref:J domain-containing protein n=1 Tax=Aspergillus cristatus TaxID=573508 RepID=A0A1E3BEB3_ASPCR|nr:hypothetical protein SI65_05930 [Aspergillus cristatus]